MAAPRMHVSVEAHAIDRFIEHFSPGLDRPLVMALIRDAAERASFFANQESPRQLWKSELGDGRPVMLVIAAFRHTLTVITVMPGDSWERNRQAKGRRGLGIEARCYKPTNRGRRIFMHRRHQEKAARRGGYRRRDDVWQ